MVVFDKTRTRVSTELSESGDSLTIRVIGNFDFHVHRDFQRAYQNLSSPPLNYRIDLSETSHLDSAALGMLLLLRDHCAREDGSRASVELLNANDHVANILAVSNFDKIFKIG